MSANRRRRLEKLERSLADLVRQEELAKCNCSKFTFAHSTASFAAEMDKTCPAHGFRRLGRITTVKVVYTGGERAGQVDEKSIGLDELVNEYKRRLAKIEDAEDE